ncbi:MAG TPA: hypothetical protein VGP26_14045 [Actinophytocola sp.]|nr:hypothetical protein [Actinophytocola sp.]
MHEERNVRQLLTDLQFRGRLQPQVHDSDNSVVTAGHQELALAVLLLVEAVTKERTLPQCLGQALQVRSVNVLDDKIAHGSRTLAVEMSDTSH